MEDPPFDENPSVVETADLPEANNDPQDPLNPEIDQDNEVEPPLADPTADMDDMNDEGAATHHNENDAVVDNQIDNNDDDDDSDVLSEVDEAQFEDFDPNAIAIVEKPAIIDSADTALLGKHKRKRVDGEEPQRSKKKKKKRSRRPDSERQARPALDADADAAALVEPELTPEERRQRDFELKLEAALATKKKASRSRKAGIDLEAYADEEIAAMKDRMIKAAEMDALARDQGKPAVLKLKMLPEVTSFLSRNTLANAVVDPDMNLLKAVRYFLEPLNDGSMPAYNIQIDLLSCLAKLPVTTDALKASEIGKVVYFYTRTKRVQPNVKRIAEKLVGEWTRPILRRNDDFRKRQLREAIYDPTTAAAAAQARQQAAAKRRSAAGSQLAAERLNNEPMRAQRSYNTLGTYTVVPKSDLSRVAGTNVRRAMAAGGEDMFRKFQAQRKANR